MVLGNLLLTIQHQFNFDLNFTDVSPSKDIEFQNFFIGCLVAYHSSQVVGIPRYSYKQFKLFQIYLTVKFRLAAGY